MATARPPTVMKTPRDRLNATLNGGKPTTRTPWPAAIRAANSRVPLASRTEIRTAPDVALMCKVV